MSQDLHLRALPPLPPAESSSSSDTTPDGRCSKRKENDADRNALLRDAIIGFSDGLTVPFALTAALSTLDSSRVVISGGLAELFAGSLSMGIGAVLASLNEKTHFRIEEAKEWRKAGDESAADEQRVYEILSRYGIGRQEAKGVVGRLRSDDGMWVKFMMDFELQLSKPSTKKAPLEGLVMGLSYFLGGLLPMIPYFILQANVQLALYISIAITAIITLIFGWLKAQFIKAGYVDRLKSALLTLALCGVATGVSYAIVWAIDHHGD